MNELEKILEEIKRIKDGNRKEKLYAKYPPDSKNQEVLNAYSQGYEDGTDNFYNAIVGTIRKHMNDGWIPVEERLPEESAYYLVTIEDYGMPYSWIKWLASSDDYNIEKSEWRELDDGEKVIAWQPLPEPYRPERSE